MFTTHSPKSLTRGWLIWPLRIPRNLWSSTSVRLSLSAQITRTSEIFPVLSIIQKDIQRNRIAAYRSKLYQIHVHGTCAIGRVATETKGFLNFIELPAFNKPSMPQLAEEYMNANNVLKSVGEVFSALGAKDRPAPYESSRLTSMLQPFLGKDAKVLIMFNLSPQISDFNFTMNTLKYASNLKTSQASQQMMKRPPLVKGPLSRGGDQHQGSREHNSGQQSMYGNSNYQGNFEGNQGDMDRGRESQGGSFNRGQQGNNRGQMGGRPPVQNNYEDRGRNFGRDNQHGQQFTGGNRNQGFGGGQQHGFQNNQMRHGRPSEEVQDSPGHLTDQEIFLRAGYKPHQIAQMNPMQKVQILERERKARQPPANKPRYGSTDRETLADLGFDTAMDLEDVSEPPKMPERNPQRGFQGSVGKTQGLGRMDVGGMGDSLGTGGSQLSSKQGTGKKASAMEVIDDENSPPKEPVAKPGKLPGSRNRQGDEIDLDESPSTHIMGPNRGFEPTGSNPQAIANQGFGGRFGKFDDPKGNQFMPTGYSESPIQQPSIPFTHAVQKTPAETTNFMSLPAQQVRIGSSNQQDAFKSPRRQAQEGGLTQASPINRDVSDSSNTPRGKSMAPGNLNFPSPQQPFSFPGQGPTGQFPSMQAASQMFNKGPMFNQGAQNMMNPSQFSQNQPNFTQEAFSQSPKQSNAGFSTQSTGRPSNFGQHSEQSQFQGGQRNTSGDFGRGQDGSFGFPNQNQNNFNRAGNGNFPSDRGNMYNQAQPQASFGRAQSQDDSIDDEPDHPPQNSRGKPQDYQNQINQRQGNFGYSGQFQGDQGFGYRGNQGQNRQGSYQGGNYQQQFSHGGQGQREGFDNYGGNQQQFNRQGGFHNPGYQGNQGNYQGFQGGQRHHGGGFGGGRGQQGNRGGNRHSNYRN